MEFNGTFELEDTTVDEVWLALSDPVMIRDALPGCEFLLEVDTDDPDFDELSERAETEQVDLEPTTDPDEIAGRAFEEGKMYAALMRISVGSVSPTFRTVVTIEERENPRMVASGEGSASNSSFEMSSGMELSETGDGGVAVEWWSEADVFGRIAQMGQRVINPVANRVVKRFFGNIQDQLRELGEEDEESPPEVDAGTADSGASGTAGDGDKKKGGIIARIKRLLGLGG